MSARPYEVGVYYFPGYHADKLVSQWHGQDWTEWQLLKAARPRYPRHDQPKVPLWGYEDEALPSVISRKAKVASQYGVNHFIFDWYHYEGQPFLNRCLDQGFLGIPGDATLKFALMWANHDWINIQPASLAGGNAKLRSGQVDLDGFHKISDLWIETYFSRENYWCIDGCPYLSIYDLPNFIKGLGGKSAARKALNELRRKAKQAGFRDVHVNLVHWQETIVGSDESHLDPKSVVLGLGFDSITSYVWVHHFPAKEYAFPTTDYESVSVFNQKYWGEMAQTFPIPYFPNVTMGWDASPRCCPTDAFERRTYPFMSTMSGNSPRRFERALQAAKQHLDSHALPVKHLNINAWNEWTEGSYLEPDCKNGFRYLQAIRNVFGRR